MAINIKYYWSTTELTGSNVCQLVRSDRAWDNADNITGVWDAALSCYAFSFDMTDTDKYDPTLTMSIYTGLVAGASSEIIADLNIGDVATGEDLETHIADTSTHGTAGAIVGTSDAQTLTQKTIDFDPDAGTPNLPSNFPADAMMAADATDDDTFHPGIVVEPDSGEDTLLIADTASSTELSLQVSNADKDTDKNLKIIAGEVILANDAGSAIQLSGLAAATANGDAVRYDEFNALDVIVQAMSVGAAWGGTPTISLRVNSPGVRNVRSTAGAGNVIFDAGEGYRDKVSRWEIYWTNDVIFDVSAGSTSADTYTYLQNNANKLLVLGQTGTTTFINFGGDAYVCVVAFDSAGVKYNSDIVEYTALVQDERDDVPGSSFFPVMSLSYDAIAASGNEAAAYIEWLQTGTTPKIKRRGGYVHNSANTRLFIYLYGKAVTSGTGYAKVAIMADTSELGSVTATFTNNSFPSTPLRLEIDVSEGLSNGMLYEIEVSTWNAATDVTNLRSDITIVAEQII